MTWSPGPMPPYLAAEVQSARTFALVGFIFFALVAAGWAIVGLALLFATVAPFFFLFPWFIPFGIFFGLSVGLTFWSWATVRDIEAGRYPPAETASLVLGILGIFVNLISGIFFLLAYTKLTELRRYAYGPPPAYGPSMYGPPSPPPADRYCVHCGRAVLRGARFCASCGKELPA